MPTIKMPYPRKRPTSEFYWIRKKVPARYRALVGKNEVWRSLETKDLRTAVRRCAAVSDALEADWARLAAAAKNSPPEAASRLPLTHRDLHGLRAVAHRWIRDAHIASPLPFSPLHRAPNARPWEQRPRRNADRRARKPVEEMAED